jgi:succinylarginine dihydrolase
MQAREINFDGLIGPTHNYAGLSLGNVASARNAGDVSAPRAAALQGLGKMRTMLGLGLAQGFFPPLRRPATTPLRALGFTGDDAAVLAAAAQEDPALLANICSASSMWTANAATVIAAPDSGDGRVHFVTANLATMLHRSIEGEESFAMLRSIFRDQRHFAVHAPLPYGRHFSDEGAANHMRVAASHGAQGINIFVHGEGHDGRFPARQATRAGEAVCRIAGVRKALHLRQSAAAIDAGAFHNDVVAVANESVILAHVDAFADRAALDMLRGVSLVEVDSISIGAAIQTYLFNSQLVTLPDGGMALIVPAETRADPDVWRAVERIEAGDNPINRVIVVNVRESMRNGGGPACLRLRVPVDEAAETAIDPRFLLDEAKIDALAALVERWWPEAVAPADLATPDFWSAAFAAHDALADHLRG